MQQITKCNYSSPPDVPRLDRGIHRCSEIHGSRGQAAGRRRVESVRAVTTKLFVMFIYLLSLSAPSLAGPWFTGPLLAPAGHTVPRGHTNVEIYGLDVLTNGFYNPSGQIIHTPLFQNVIANPIITHGFTDWMDVQLILPYTFDRTQDRQYNRLADVSAAIGLQLLEQKGAWWRPDIRLAIQEIIPTGRFEDLNPLLLGTDSTGLGSYQTAVNLNFQHLAELFHSHYLRTRLSLTRLYAGPVEVEGFNSYGGSFDTHARVHPSTQDVADLAFEYTLTQNWVAVMEGYISQGNSKRVDDDFNVGGTENVGPSNHYQQALAPAIEYNFTSQIGLIGGVWFPVRGKNTANFTTYVLALNMYW